MACADCQNMRIWGILGASCCLLLLTYKNHIDTVAETSKYTYKYKRGQHVIVHLHVHKNGGSSVCRIATANNLTSTSSRQNCNVFEVPNEIPCNVALNPNSSCVWGKSFTERKAWAKRFHVDFVAPEYMSLPSHAGSDQEAFLYTFSVRHPFSRLVSDLRHDYVTRALMNASDRLPHILLMETQPDNFMTRVLAGIDLTASTTVTSSHYQIAKDNLEKISVVMIVEDYQNTLPLLAWKFGWQHWYDHHGNHEDWPKDKRLNDSYILRHLLDNFPKLTTRERYDLRLYLDAMVRVRKDLVRAQTECLAAVSAACASAVQNFGAGVRWIDNVLS